jgi:hypothetical protein
MFRRIVCCLSLTLVLTGLPAQEIVDRKLTSFSEIVVSDRISVRLVKSTTESASIKVQGVQPSSVKTEVTDNTLMIQMHGEPFNKRKVIITLNYMNIKAITVNGGAEVSTIGLLKTDTLTVDLKSGGMLYLDADIGYLKGIIAESALLNAEGYANEQNILVVTSGTLSAFELESEKIKVRASSGGKAKIFVENELDAEASSNGFISFKGNPSVINRKVNSGGTISVYEP